jgi:hypothetical protein
MVGHRAKFLGKAADAGVGRTGRFGPKPAGPRPRSCPDAPAKAKP